MCEGDDDDKRKHYQGSMNILVVAESVGGFTKEVRLCVYVDVLFVCFMCVLYM